MDVKLVLFKKNGTQKAFDLPSTSTVVGRRHDCDLWIALKQVSKRHCQLSVDNGSLKVRDLGSRNGTFVNGKKVDQTDAKPGDYLRVGPLTFLLQIDGRPAQIVPPPDDILAADAKSPAGAKKPTSAKKAAAKKAAPKTPAARANDDDLIDFDEPGDAQAGGDLDDLEAEFADLDGEIDDSLEDL